MSVWYLLPTSWTELARSSSTRRESRIGTVPNCMGFWMNGSQTEANAMKLSKQQIKDGRWILAIGLILFTPVAFHLRVWIIGQISSHISAGVVEKDLRSDLGDYQWQLVDLEGNPMDFRTLKGEVILVNIW